MAVAVQMPKHGNTVEECLLVEWKVKEGDSVGVGDAICSIETDKASFDVEATAAGVVLKLLAAPGDLVPVLTDIAIIGQAGESAANVESPAKGDAIEVAATPFEVPIESHQPETQAGLPPPVSATAASAFKAVSPRARKLAEKLGVDTAAVYGSGPGGRVTSRDVQMALDNGSAVRTSSLAKEVMASTGQVPRPGSGIGGLCRARDLIAAETPGGLIPVQEPEPEVIPYKGMRKLIGDRMHQSLAEHAQLTMNASADASALMALRAFFKENTEAAGLPNITINDMICWVTAQTLAAFPAINAILDKQACTITRHGRVNLGVAVDTPRGLMVPVIADAHRLSLAGMSRIIAEYAEECRKGSINPDLLSGGTFTISNLGGVGVESFTPILNAPQAAILGVCAITSVPAPRADGGFEFKPRLGLSITIDHQVVDGAPGARFLQAVAKGIENIDKTLAMFGAY